MGLKPSQNQGWDLSPWARTRIHCLLIDIAHLVSGLNEAQVLYVSAQRNSGRGKVIGKKWVYLEIHTPQTECYSSQKVRDSEIWDG